jgi:pimeloyl-ACP methyl ester carboxylesterase
LKDKNNLILLPGLLCDSDLWTHQVTYLADVAVCRVADVTEADTMEEIAESVLSVSPERFALAGLSMGG